MVGENGSGNTGNASNYNNLGGRIYARSYIGEVNTMRIQEILVIKDGQNLCAQIYGTCDDMQGRVDFKLQLQYVAKKPKHYISPISDWELINVPEKDLPEIIQDDLLSCADLGLLLRNPYALRKDSSKKYCPRLERGANGLTVDKQVDLLNLIMSCNSDTPPIYML